MQCNFLQEQGKIQIPFEWSYEKKWLKAIEDQHLCLIHVMVYAMHIFIQVIL